MKNENIDIDIAETMGLDDEWAVLNSHRISKALINSETKNISEILIDTITRIKKEEFGELDHEITNYEKKLIISGLQLYKLQVQSESSQPFYKMILGNQFGGNPNFLE